MFAAVYDDDCEVLGSLLSKYPDAILGSWGGMPVLRHTFVVPPQIEHTACLLLLPLYLVKPTPRTLADLKSVFAGALVMLCEKPRPIQREGPSLCAFNTASWRMALPGLRPWSHACPPGGSRQPVAASLHALADMAMQALGKRADLAAVQSLCQGWAAVLR